MKKLNYIFVLVMIISACSSGGDDSGSGGSGVNKAPNAVGSLTYPTNNLLCVTNVLDFEWSASTDPNGDAVSYVLEISKDNQFTTIDKTFTVTTTIKTVTLSRGEAYYWRVKAVDSKDATSDYSSINQFYTEREGEVNHLPFAPQNIAPLNSASISGSSVDLNWNASDVDGDTLKYDVYFGTEAVPTAKAGSNITEKSLSVNVSSGLTYYWKVVVKDSNGGQALGQVWSFSVQ